MIKAITVRNIPVGLAQRLRQLAKERNMSLTRLVVMLLEEATGLSRKPLQHHDFDKYAGTWTAKEAREFDAALAEQRRIDPEDWT